MFMFCRCKWSSSFIFGKLVDTMCKVSKNSSFYLPNVCDEDVQFFQFHLTKLIIFLFLFLFLLTGRPVTQC